MEVASDARASIRMRKHVDRSSSSCSSVTVREEEIPMPCRRGAGGGALWHRWMPCLLIAATLGCLDYVSGATEEVWSSVRFPEEELGPDNWRYYRGQSSCLLYSLYLRSHSHSIGLMIIMGLQHSQQCLWSALDFLDLHLVFHQAGNSTASLFCSILMISRERGFQGKSLLEAAISAGSSQNASAKGECAWFNDTVVVNVTNLEVLSGTLHIGIFSDPKPTRTQSKMIPRGEKYSFGVGIQVFWCGTETLGGPDCSLEIVSLLPPVFLESLNSMHALLHDDQTLLSIRSSRNYFKKELGDRSYDDLSSEYAMHLESESSFEIAPKSKGPRDKDLISLKNEKQLKYLAKALKSGWSEWISSSYHCVGLDDKKFFSLQIVDFVQVLEIKYDCISNVSHGISKCEEFESMVKESRIPLLHLRYGALPGKYTSDFLGEPSTGSIIVPEPKRGWWYLAFFNPMVASNQEGMRMLSSEDEICLTLSWRAKTCGPGLTGNDCQWPVVLLERILKEEVESPFDSYYYLASKSDSLDQRPEWFSLESLSNASASNVTVEQWVFAILKVADGAAGSVLSIDVQMPLTMPLKLYARYEGCPTNSNWDFQVRNEVTQHLSKHGSEQQGLEMDGSGSQVFTTSKYQSLSLHIVYPMEGYWCIGLEYVPHQIKLQSSVLENPSAPNSSPEPNRQGTQQPTGDWMHRWKLYIMCYEGKLSFLTKPFLNGETRMMCEGHSVDGLDTELGNLFSEEKMQLQVTMHGCPNKCSDHGSCQTAYEASRLHFISYCRCDVIHGDFDCSAALLGLWKDLRQRSLLIFSNAAAILPSMWAFRHHAYSELITFTLSGIASAVYHSCDAGGWCAMSYSTLQFLDFWLSFVAIIMTCLVMAGFTGPTKAVLHIGCAVLTATVAKEDATSGWSVLVVVLISSTGLLLGWVLQTQRVSLLRPRWPIPPNRSNVACLQLCQGLVRSFFIQLRDRFHWHYLWLGLAFLLSALLSNRMEMPETYWIYHSWWHICIYTCAFILLYSIKANDGTSTRREDTNGYQSVSVSHRQAEDSITDSHEALVLELDSFAENHAH